MAGCKQSRVHALLQNSYQCIVLHHRPAFGRNLNGKFFSDPNCMGLRELWVRELHQSKAHPRLPNTFKYKALLDLPPFGWKSHVKIKPPLSPVWGIRADLGGRNGTNRNCDHIPIRLPYTLVTLQAGSTRPSDPDTMTIA